MLHGQTRYNIASSFFEEIPAALMKRIGSRFRSESSRFRSQSAGPRVAGPRAATTQPSTFGSQADTPWRIGQNVTHPKFGAGVIVNAEGGGVDARVQVNFHRNGTKWLALEYAKLAPA